MYLTPSTTKNWDTDYWTDYWVTITGGTGIGQYRKIASNTATTLTVTENWSTSLDATSTYRINYCNRQGAYALLEINQGGNYITRVSIKERDGKLVQSYAEENDPDGFPPIGLSKLGDIVHGSKPDSEWLKYMTMDIDFFNLRYYRGSVSTLPADDSALETEFIASDYVGVAAPDDQRIFTQQLDDTYGIYLFKARNNDNESNISIIAELQTTIAPTISPVYLEIYNRNSELWEQVV